ncbi:MAG: hypothetical protein ACLUGJ_11555 [Blautia wexlerae]
MLREEEFDKIYQICQEGSKQNKLEHTALRIPGRFQQSRGKEVCAKIASLKRGRDGVSSVKKMKISAFFFI